MKENNANLLIKKEGGFIHLYISYKGVENIQIKLCDYGGTQKARNKKLLFKLLKLSEEK